VRKLILFAYLAASAVPTAYSSTISINGSISTSFGGEVGVTEVKNMATASDMFISAQGLPYAFGTADYYARAAFANLGLSYDASAVCTDIHLCNQVSASGIMTTNSLDQIHVAGASTSDFLKLNLVLDGTVTQMADKQAGLSQASIGYDLLTTGGIVSYVDSLVCTVQTDNCSDGTSVNTYVLLQLASDNGGPTISATVQQRLIFQFGCGGTFGLPCYQTGDFANSALIGGATVVDANGNVVQGATIFSDSGYDYTQAVSEPTTVPEPTTIALELLGLAVGSVSWLRLRRAGLAIPPKQ
jgi:hypothetical protein